ncbi:MAG: ABC transporter substrate-binding protein [Bacteroidales bacterium]|nr:ABC transporter substrate-binding protein [Bacteroidales bacterium]
MRFRPLLPLTLLFIIASCSQQRHPDKQIFHYNESAGIATLDPAFAKDQSIIWPCRQLYNGLVQLGVPTDAGADTVLCPIPSIARRWEISPDGLTYTFTLRTDVSFHPPVSRTVTAADFLYSFRRLTDPTVASPGAWIMANVSSMEAPDDTTFVIHLNTPFAPFLSQLAMVYCSVVPHEAVEKYGKEYRSHPCGTGPFQFQYWKEGVKLVLRRNPDYFERDEQGHPLPYLDAVAISFIVDRQTVFLEFIKGNLDFMNSLDASYKDELLTRDGKLNPKYAERLDLHTSPYLNTEYLGFLIEDATAPLADRRVRQAINYGIDRRKMMRYLRNNIGTPGEYGFIPPGLPGALTESLYPYRPDRSRQLLAEAGYPNGTGMPRLKLCTTAGYLDLCKYIQQQLGTLGLDVQVDVSPPAALREQIAQGRAQWFRGSWVADYPDAENYLSLFYTPNRTPAGPNYTRFSSPTIDRLYLRARTTTDADSCRAIYSRIDSLIMQQAPVVVLYYDQILHFTHKNVRGLRSDAMNTLDLRRVTVR